MVQDESELAFLQRIAAQSVPEIPMPQETAPEEPDVPEDQPFGWSLPGFGAGARVMTSFGLVPVEALRRRDPVRTHSGQFPEVQYVDEIRLDRRFLLTHPEAQPVFIPRGGLGASAPNRHMLVSGQQKVRSPGRFDQAAGQAAVELIGRGGIARKSHGYFTYYVFHCGAPCTVNVDGLWVDLDPGGIRTELHS